MDQGIIKRYQSHYRNKLMTLYFESMVSQKPNLLQSIRLMAESWEKWLLIYQLTFWAILSPGISPDQSGDISTD